MVVQKETTISQATMETFSREVGAAAPFISDFMTVCSERQREFWVRAGADAGVIEVTGQPRFDVYATANEESPSTPRRVLFLTYALDAYVPGAGRGDGSLAWHSLREETEAALLEQVRAGACELVVKCHPQQGRAAEARRLAALAGPLWNHGISIAAQDADTRDVIMAADVVVGFQTTALYEAVAARRNVIYAAWGAAYERHRAGPARVRGHAVLLRRVPPRGDDRLHAPHPRLAPARTRLDGHAAIVFFSFFGWGVAVFNNAHPPADAMEVFVIGKQWMWKAQYPNGQRVIIGGNPRNMTEAERKSIGKLVLPVNRPVKITMTSEDVIHDFGIPAFRSKMDVLPGRVHAGVVPPDQDRRVPHLLRPVLRHVALADGRQDRRSSARRSSTTGSQGISRCRAREQRGGRVARRTRGGNCS